MEKLRILSVDDEEDNQFIIQLLFQENYEVQAAHSGEECIDILNSFTPDIILMDVAMPGMDGYETCRQLKQQAELKDIPVIFLSARIQPEDRIKGYDSGGHDYMVKPFDHTELIAKVETTIHTVVESQHEKTDLAEQIKETNEIFMQSMDFSYNLGSVLQFFEESFQCYDLQSLSTAFFAAAQKLKMNVSIQYRHKTDIETFSATGHVTQLEIDVLDLVKDKGRFFDFGKRTVINDKSVSILIKDMPIDDDVKFGQTKDVLSHFINALSARVEFILMEIEIKERREKATAKMVEILEGISNKFFELSKESVTTLEDMVENIHEQVTTYHLTHNQEEHLFNLLETSLEKNSHLFNEGLRLDNAFEEIKNVMTILTEK